jgi:hypothetical protein
MTKFRAQANAHKLMFQTKRGLPTDEGFRKMTLARKARMTPVRIAEIQ